MAEDLNLSDAMKIVEGFSSGRSLSARISRLESNLAMKDLNALDSLLVQEGVTDSIIHAAMKIKRVAGQINVIIHAAGILISLPYILEPDEKIQSLSLGAGNTGREFDLETNKRVAEFKFITWRGGSESIRQNTVFIDLFCLAECETTRRRCLYVVGKEQPIRFLNNRRAIRSVLSKNQAVSQQFYEKYGDKHSVVS